MNAKKRKMAITKNEKGISRGGGDHTQSVTVPSLFRCPISLDVMRSPVSLCTGVTYDRSSIQRWLESGNATCPATMQPLPSTDLVPNLTLHRLINLWVGPGDLTLAARALLADLRSSPSPSAASLRNLAALFGNAGGDVADEFEKNRLVGDEACAETLISTLSNAGADPGVLEEAAGVIAGVLTSDWIEKENKQSLIRKLEASITHLIRALKQGRNLEARANAGIVIDELVSNIPAESRVSIAENHRDLIPELIRLIDESKSDVAGISCLIHLAPARSARVRMVRLGIVPVLTRILTECSNAKAMKLMEIASSIREGREAICEIADAAVSAIMKRMMKVGREGTEGAIVILWSLCHLFRDRRAQEAAAAVDGGMMRILVAMQSGCSPAAREMAGDLLRVFRVRGKGCIGGGYNTKTMHIMPF